MRNPGDQTGITFHRPGHGAVRSAKCAEISERTIAPKSGVATLVSGEIGITGEPAAIINAIRATVRSAERRQIGNCVLL